MAGQTPRLTLAEELLSAIGEGRTAVATASRFAAARVAEGGADASCTMLADCNTRNGERKLHRWAKGQWWRQLLPEPYSFEAPLQKLGRQVSGHLHCILPHMLFARLASGAPLVFDQLFGSAEQRAAFWSELERTGREEPEGARGRVHREWLRRHPVLSSVDPLKRVPVGIHGDGGEMTSGEKVMVLSWGGICNPGATLDTRLLFACLKESEMVHEGHATLFAAFAVLAWSMTALADGVHPRVDHNGRPFASDHWPAMARVAGQSLSPDSLRAAWLELRGDWQFLRAALHLQQHYGAINVCHLCQVTSRGLGHYGEHLSRASPLRLTLVTARGWQSGTPRSPLCQIPGFNIWRCSFDAMHTLELGIYQRVIPAALCELLGVPVHLREQGIFGRGNVAARCMAATRAYHAWARETRVPSSSRVKAITAGWVKGVTPQLSQSHAKAAALRAMLPWVATLCEQQAASSPRRAELLRALLAMDRVWLRAPRFLTRQQADLAAGHCERALAALRALVQAQQEAGAQGPWRLIPKVHALTHLAYDGAMGNPRAAHCYQDEDFVGRIKRIYVRCHGRSAPLRAVQRYALHCSLRLNARHELLTGVAFRDPACVGEAVTPAASSASAAASSSRGARGVKRGRGRPKSSLR